MWKMVQSISGWTDIQNLYGLSRGRIYIYVCVCVEFLASHFNQVEDNTEILIRYNVWGRGPKFWTGT